MRFLIALITLLITQSLFAQIPICSENVSAGDEPPGCLFCTTSIVSGTLSGYSSDTAVYTAPFVVDQGAWVSFVADAFGTIEVTLLASNCNTGKGIEIAPFDQNLESIVAIDNNGGPTNRFTLNGLIAGELYYFLIDGVDGDACDFTLILNGFNTNCTSSINDVFVANKLFVVPNPTNGRVQIKTDLKVDEIAIHDFSGRLLQKEVNTSFDLKRFGAGVYFLKIKTNEGVGVKRVVVN